MKAAESDIAWCEVLHRAVQNCDDVAPGTIANCLVPIKMFCFHISLYLTVALPGANVRSASSKLYGALLLCGLLFSQFSFQVERLDERVVFALFPTACATCVRVFVLLFILSYRTCTV